MRRAPEPETRAGKALPTPATNNTRRPHSATAGSRGGP